MRPVLRVLLIVGVAGAAACSGARERHPDQVLPAAPARNHAKVDVPSLLGLSIDKLSQRAGPRLPVPAGFSDPVVPSTGFGQQLDSTVFFRWRDLPIVASYNYRTRHVNDLILLGNNEDELMHRAKLQLSAENYLVMPVFQEGQPTQLLGLRVLAITPGH